MVYGKSVTLLMLQKILVFGNHTPPQLHLCIDLLWFFLLFTAVVFYILRMHVCGCTRSSKSQHLFCTNYQSSSSIADPLRPNALTLTYTYLLPYSISCHDRIRNNVFSPGHTMPLSKYKREQKSTVLSLRVGCPKKLHVNKPNR